MLVLAGVLCVDWKGDGWRAVRLNGNEAEVSKSVVMRAEITIWSMEMER